MAQSLKQLSFLIGEWKGSGEGFGTSKNTDISNSLEFEYGPSSSIITGRFEARRAGKMENNGIMILLHDNNIGKFVRKQVYSYGFVMNEVGDAEGDKFTFDCVSIDAEPDYWRGMKIRSFLVKHSNDEISMGLEIAKKGEDYQLYGKNRFRRIR